MSEQDSLPLDLPPSRYVRQFAGQLDTDVSRSVLDVGCHTGRNSLYLARLGHDVIGIDNDIQAVTNAANAVGVANSALRGSASFAVGDIRQLPIRKPFDIVLSNEVLHLVTKPQAQRTLMRIRELTKQGGINLISGYVVRPDTANARNAAMCFHPGELAESYAAAGWRILEYEEIYHPHQTVQQREIISSIAHIIAERPWEDGRHSAGTDDT